MSFKPLDAAETENMLAKVSHKSVNIEVLLKTFHTTHHIVMLFGDKYKARAIAIRAFRKRVQIMDYYGRELRGRCQAPFPALQLRRC
jgi:hypothetical protein